LFLGITVPANKIEFGVFGLHSRHTLETIFAGEIDNLKLRLLHQYLDICNNPKLHKQTTKNY